MFGEGYETILGGSGIGLSGDDNRDWPLRGVVEGSSRTGAWYVFILFFVGWLFELMTECA